jgi:L-alanine-DL-glutamate epimerase-like enolase superfamily enzyme
VHCLKEKVFIQEIRVLTYRVPTDSHESDGTYEWNATTLVLVEAKAGGMTGLGLTYANVATAQLVRDTLAEIVRGTEAMDVSRAWSMMQHALRNLGSSGIGAMAVSAVDNALWDLKARLLGQPLVKILGATRDALPVYGSGGFTSYSIEKLQKQLHGWIEDGIPPRQNESRT